MIKFFRNIRKKLIEQGKTVSYLKYAIGEILLVVIGILIALQVNNWNEQRKVYAEETRILTSLQKDLDQARTELGIQIKIEQGYVDALQLILTDSPERELLFKNPKADSILYAPLIATRTEVPVIQTYSDLKSSGQVSMITNQLLRENLVGLESSLIELGIQAADNLTIQQLNMDAIVIQELDLPSIINGRRKDVNLSPLSKNDYRSILSKQNIVNALTLKWLVMDGVLRYRLELDGEIKSLIELIEKELK